MLQYVATAASCMIVVGTLALIVGFLAEDWEKVKATLSVRRPGGPIPPPAPRRHAADRRPRVVRVSPQSAPRHAAA